MRFRDVLESKQVRMTRTDNPNPVIHAEEGVWVIVERRDRTERCRFLVDSEVYEELVKPFRWNVGGANYRRVYHSAWAPGGSKRSSVLLSRWLQNPPADTEVDHINRDPLDNRRGNLRLSTRKQNEENRERKSRGKSSKHRGVHFDPPTGKWRAAVTHNYRQHNSPRFLTEGEAHAWAVATRKELFTHTQEEK